MKKIIYRRLILVIILQTILVGYAQEKGKTYYLKSALEGKYLEVKDNNPNRLAPLQLWDYRGSAIQQFTLVDAGGGYFYMKSNTKDKRAIHVQNADKNPKAKVNLWEIVNQDNLKWKFVDAGNGYYYIQSKLGTNLDVQWGKSTNGTPIWMWGANKGNAQKWKFIEVKNKSLVGFHPQITVTRGLTPTKEISRTRNEIKKTITHKRNYNGNKNEKILLNESIKKEDEYCTSYKYTVENASSEDLGFIITSGGFDNNIFPGGIYKSNAFIDGSLKSPQLDRIPYNIAIDLVSASSGRLSTMVGNDSTAVNYTSASQAISELLKENKKVEVSSNNAIILEEVSDLKQLQVNFSAGASSLSGGVSGSTSYTAKQKKKIFVGRFFQRYYTISLNDSPELTATNKNIQLDDLYISEVSYGRIGYVKIVSEGSLQEVQAAFNAKVNTPLAGGNASMDTKMKLISNNWNFTAYTTGGSARTITSVKGFVNWAKDARWNPNVSQKPIGYKLKYLKDHTAAYVNMNTSFTKYECRKQQAYKLTFLGIGYSKHNKEDCSRIYAKIKANFNEIDQSGDIVRTIEAKNSTNDVLVEWDKPNSKEWSKKHGMTIGNDFRLTAFNVNKLKADRTSLTFYADPNLVNDNLLDLNLSLYFKSCHKDGNGISGFNCGVRLPKDTPVYKKFKLNNDLMSNAIKNEIYFDSGFINGSQNHQWKVYFKMEKL